MDEDIKEALINAQVLEYFESLPPSHKAEYTNWINEAVKPETRKNRIIKMALMLKAKQK